jgi:Domain of Unknown Function (DUF1080)
MSIPFDRQFYAVLSSFAILSLTCSAQEANQLTSAEQTAGWKLLFDGKTTHGWRSFKQDTFPQKGWVVEDGWLKCIAGARSGDIITTDEFSDFELQWEWRLPAKANNGVKYFITEQREQPIGHEYQMLDDSTDNRPKEQTASFYNVLGPLAHKPMRLAPETNLSRVIVQGNHVEHWLNGEKVLEYECGSEALKAAIAQSKFKRVPGFGDKITGHILLTEHHDEAWFRNIKIRPLPAPPKQ